MSDAQGARLGTTGLVVVLTLAVALVAVVGLLAFRKLLPHRDETAVGSRAGSVGQGVSDGALDYVVRDVRCDGTSVPGIDDPPQRGQFCVVRLEVVNAGTTLRAFTADLVTDTGVSVPLDTFLSYQASGGSGAAVTAVTASQRRSVTLVFDIDAGARPARVELAVGDAAEPAVVRL